MKTVLDSEVQVIGLLKKADLSFKTADILIRQSKKYGPGPIYKLCWRSIMLSRFALL